MASHGARDELDEVLDAILHAIPPEHHAEMRALLHASRKRRPRKQAAASHPIPAPDDAASDNEDPPVSPPTPLPPITLERATRIPDDIILAAMRAAGAPPNSPLALRTLTGVGIFWEALAAWLRDDRNARHRADVRGRRPRGRIGRRGRAAAQFSGQLRAIIDTSLRIPTPLSSERGEGSTAWRLGAPLPAHWAGYRVPSGRGGGWGEGQRHR